MKILKILTFFFMATGAFAQCTNPTCSLVLPNTANTATVLSAALGAVSFRVEARMHGQNWASMSNVQPLFNAGGYRVDYFNQVLFVGGADTVSGGYGNCDIPPGTPTDFTLRIDRDLVHSQLRFEIFNTTGGQIGSTCLYTITSPASSGTIQGGGISVGAANATVLGGDIAFLRWYNNSVPAGTPVQIGIASPATLGDWEFDNSLADTSGLSQNLGGSGTYVNTPVYNPSCNAGTPQTLRLGTAMTMNGSGSSPLDGGSTLTYSWVYAVGSDGVNQAPTFTGTTTATPLASGMGLFGSANFTLTVTDGTSHSSSCTVHNGMVSADATTGIINLTAEGVSAAAQKFIGPVVRLGTNLWPFADQMHVAWAGYQISNLATYYTPFWRNLQSGTVSVTGGSTTITGSGTNLLLPCYGTHSPSTGPAIFLQYPGSDGLTHYLPAEVVACTDATHMTVKFPFGVSNAFPLSGTHVPYPNCDSGCSGWGWSWGDASTTQPQEQFGIWQYNPAPGNYYDNAKSFYALYLRSGIDTYQAAFHTMADTWWEYPYMDQGYACNLNGSNCPERRSQSINGIVLRALEEGPTSPKWAGLQIVFQASQYYMSLLPATPATAWGIDIRENGYAMSTLAYCALANPAAYSTGATSCKLSIKNALTNWTAIRRPDTGVWASVFFTSTSIVALGGSGSQSACVTNGSTTVTGTGTAWDPSQTGYEVWFFPSPNALPATNSVGDPVGYGVTVTSPTSITLSSAYAGTTGCTGVSGSNKGYLFGYPQGSDPSVATNGFTGWGILPYMEGILATGFSWAAQAMDDAAYDPASATLYRTYAHTAVNWLISSAINPYAGGLYAGSTFVGCSPPVVPVNVACNNGDPSQTRTLSLDVMRAFAMDYQLTSSSTTKTSADLLMSQMFSVIGIGGPNPDGNYIAGFSSYFATGTPPQGFAPKWFGQLCGYQEACDMWPAVRLLGGTGGGSRVTGPVRSKGVVIQ